MGIKGAVAPLKQEQMARLWRDPVVSADLSLIGLEVPEQMAALFVMDGDEIDRLTRDVAPLTDTFPKRLTDEHWDEQATHRFALPYLKASSALQRFLASPLIIRRGSEPSDNALETCFIIRDTRYRCGIVERCNTLAELDRYLRNCPLRAPVLETLGSDEFRLAIAERIAGRSETPPLDITPDLIAGALARRDIGQAIGLLEGEQKRGAFSLNDTYLLTYLYCLNGSVAKAEALAATSEDLLKRNAFVDWLWAKLETDFAFHPPTWR
jgi:hypothetical protein